MIAREMVLSAGMGSKVRAHGMHMALAHGMRRCRGGAALARRAFRFAGMVRSGGVTASQQTACHQNSHPQITHFNQPHPQTPNPNPSPPTPTQPQPQTGPLDLMKLHASQSDGGNLLRTLEPKERGDEEYYYQATDMSTEQVCMCGGGGGGGGGGL